MCEIYVLRNVYLSGRRRVRHRSGMSRYPRSIVIILQDTARWRGGQQRYFGRETCPGLQGAIMVRLNWSDEDLAQRLQQRDPDALETLISRYSREVYYFIRLVLDGVGLTQDAEECVNDLFVAVWQEIETFDPERGTLRTWLTMRAKYIALDRRRQLFRRQVHNVQVADENRQWATSENAGSRAMSSWGG